MIKPLQIASLTFPSNLIQGPLAGISCAPFRELSWRHGKPAFNCTEMISCKTLIQPTKHIPRRYIEKSSHEGPVCFQLAAHDPNELSEAVKRVTDAGADLIDLNCGCPVKKMRSKGEGSGLLTQPSRLFELISAMKKNTHVPVTVKIRIEKENGETFHEEVAQAISDAGADALIVHGRHWTEHYETPVRFDPIRYFVERLSIPVIGNGDIRDLASLQAMFSTGCAGVMFGRAGVGQPWLIQQLTAEWNQENFTPPSLKERGELFLCHVEQLAELIGSEKLAVFQSRQFGKYYARGVQNREEFVELLNNCHSFSGLKNIFHEFFEL